MFYLEDNSIYSTIREEIRGLDIGVLVNNVGMSYDYPEFFDKVEDSAKLVNNMIRCNVDSVAYLTQMILPCVYFLLQNSLSFLPDVQICLKTVAVLSLTYRVSLVDDLYRYWVSIPAQKVLSIYFPGKSSIKIASNLNLRL